MFSRHNTPPLFFIYILTYSSKIKQYHYIIL
nr:MAG TPA: hypothetical protein [Caudoviricetes sp.]